MTVITIAIIAFGIRLNLLGNQSREMSPELGVIAGELKACPDKPNCVNSFADTNDDHFIKPLDKDLNLSDVKGAIKSSELNWELKDESPNYLYYTSESKVMGFVDDIEILKMNNMLHFRSASRVGYSDLGANKTYSSEK